MQQKDLTIRYSCVPAFFWMSFAAVMSFSSYYLLANGFTNSQIGWIAAIGGLIAAVLQPLVAGYADKDESLSLKTIELVIVVTMLVLAVILLVSEGKSRTLTGGLFACLIILLQLQTPLVNALGTESLNQGKKLNFGVSRATGSLGYAVMAYGLGTAAEMKGKTVVPLGIIFVYSCLLIAVLCFPFQKEKKGADEDKKSQNREKKRSLNPIAFFMKYRRFTIVLAGCIFMYISHNLINNFTLQIIETKGGGSAEMGTAQAMASVLEIPVIFFFGYLLKKARCDIWFRIAAVFFFLKTFCTLLAPNIPIFYGVQIFQMFGWALMTVASVYYVNGIMKKEDAIKGQAYMTMTFTLGMVIGSILGGTLIDRFSVHTMLIAGSICGLIGMVIIILAAEKTEKETGV